LHKKGKVITFSVESDHKISDYPMNTSLFGSYSELDTAFLEEAYADDAESAAIVFQQYLDDLPNNLELINESIRKNDIEAFRRHVHKQKPAFSYVGLTDVTGKFHDLLSKCHIKEDLSTYHIEIEEALDRIRSSSRLIEKTLADLKQY
jgi:HPt (histidine-containing phosphotransfer) domain-containing protein